MRPMVLDGMSAPGRQIQGVRRGGVPRMEIVSDEQIIPVDAVHGNEVLDTLLERFECFVMIQVTNVLADEGLAIDGKANGVFQVGANCKNGLRRGQRRSRAGRMAARSP